MSKAKAPEYFLYSLNDGDESGPLPILFRYEQVKGFSAFGTGYSTACPEGEWGALDVDLLTCSINPIVAQVFIESGCTDIPASLLERCPSISI